MNQKRLGSKDGPAASQGGGPSLLSGPSGARVPTGTSTSPRSIAAFQSRRARVSRYIREQNRGPALPHAYLKPPGVGVSIAV